MDTTPLTPSPLKWRQKSRFVAWFDLIMTSSVSLSYLYLAYLYVKRKPYYLENGWIICVLVVVFTIQMVIYFLRFYAVFGLMKATKYPNDMDAPQTIKAVDYWEKANLIFMVFLFISCLISFPNFSVAIPQTLVIVVYGIFHYIVGKHLRELKRTATEPNLPSTSSGP